MGYRRGKMVGYQRERTEWGIRESGQKTGYQRERTENGVSEREDK